MDEYTKQFGERVKARRKAMGLTQTDLALRMGFKSKQAISHIEAGDRNLKQSQVAALAAALGVTPAYLMGWEDTNLLNKFPRRCKADDGTRTRDIKNGGSAKDDLLKMAENAKEPPRKWTEPRSRRLFLCSERTTGPIW